MGKVMDAEKRALSDTTSDDAILEQLGYTQGNLIHLNLCEDTTNNLQNSNVASVSWAWLASPSASSQVGQH